MTTKASLQEQIERQSVVSVESTISGEMTVEQWRASRPRRRRSAPHPGGQRVVPLRPVICDHLCDTTTRYDRAAKRLTFLLVCSTCGSAEVIETLHYEPRFVPTDAPSSPDAAGLATVHELPVRGRGQYLRPAA
jgi:hypothetical protein